MRTDKGGEVAKDPRHLVALGDFGLTEPVRVLDRGEWFDEERLPRSRRIMDDAGDLASGRRLEREDRPAGSFGDEVVLQVLSEARIARDLP